MSVTQSNLRSEIAAVIRSAKLSHDPMAAVLECQLHVMDQMEHVVASLDGQIAKISTAASRGAYQRVGALVGTHLARYALIAVGAIVACMVLVGLAVHAWDGGFRTSCDRVDDGSVVCWYRLSSSK